MIDVSIIFVNYNTRELTINAIKSVYDFTKTIRVEVIVVDNASLDNSVQAIRQKFSDVVLIESKENLGFGKGNNRGLEIAKGKYIFFLNTDTYLLNNAIEVLFYFMENNKNNNVAVCGAKLFKEDLSANVSAGIFPNYRLFVKGSFLKYLYSGNYYSGVERREIPNEFTKPFEVDYVSGADFFVRRSVLDRTGGFDKRFFMYAEDAELSFRIKQALPKMKNMIVPKAKIVHISQGSSKSDSTSKKFRLRFIRSRAIFYKIHEGIIPSCLYYIVSLKRLYFN
ncbi:glycosyltransferase family 2 protein [Flavobacteriaceae sp. LMIT009]